MAYHQDLVHRGGPPQSRHRREPQNPYEDCDNDRPGPGGSDGRYHSGNEEWHRQLRDPHSHPRDSHSRSSNSRKLPRMKFEDALADLFDLLNASLAFYSNFKSEFDNEIQGVAAYAGIELLDKLWARRVKYSEDRRGGCGDPRDRELARDRSQAPQDFTGTFRLLREKFEMVLHASQTKRPQRSGHDDGRAASYVRIVQKVKAGGKDITQLAANAKSRHGDIEPLMMELELLITYLEKNKGVWGDGERGEEGRYDEHGNGGVEEQESCE